MTRNHMSVPGPSSLRDGDERDDWARWVDEADPPPPSPRYWDTTALLLALGLVAGFTLACIPAALIIWRLTHE